MSPDFLGQSGMETGGLLYYLPCFDRLVDLVRLVDGVYGCLIVPKTGLC